LNSEQAIRAVRERLAGLFGLASGSFPRRSKNFVPLCEITALRLRETPALWFAAVLQAFTGGVLSGIEAAETDPRLCWWFEELQMIALFREMMAGNFSDDPSAPLLARLLPIWAKNDAWLERLGKGGVNAASLFREFMADDKTRDFLQIHAYDGTLWYRKESFELFLDSLEMAGVLHLLIHPDLPKRQPRIYAKLSGVLEKWRKAHEKSGYQVEKFFKRLK